MSDPVTGPRGVRHVVAVVAQVLLGIGLLGAGLAHLTVRRAEFQAQVPSWVPVDPDPVVVVSGVVEIVLGVALLALWRHRAVVGIVVAAFFIVIFPGNIAQFVERTDAFGLTSDLARGLRLLGQPLLVAWALWCTGAWAMLTDRFRARRPAS